MSYAEIVGAAAIKDFELVDPFMPHRSTKQYWRIITGSDWLFDTLAKHFDTERSAPVSLLLHRRA